MVQEWNAALETGPNPEYPAHGQCAQSLLAPGEMRQCWCLPLEDLRH